MGRPFFLVMIFASLKQLLKESHFRKAVQTRLYIRLGMTIVIALIWHLFLSSPGRRVDLPLLLLAIIFIGWAWILYLRQDNLLRHGLVSRLSKSSPLAKKRAPSMMDYVDEDPVDDGPEEEKTERRLATFCANLISGGICLVGSLICGYLLS